MIPVILDRLEKVLSEETRALSGNAHTDVRPFTQQKNQLLLELTRSRQDRGDPQGAAELAARLQRLKTLVAANERALAIQLEAAGEVAAVIMDALRQQDSDGTYTPFSAYARRP